jgi:uncharacterized protein (TIGR02996 family)
MIRGKKRELLVAQTEHLIDKLVADELLELGRTVDRAVLVADAATYLHEIWERPQRASAFGEWLARQRGVVEVYGSDDELEAAIAELQHVAPPKRRQVSTRTDYPRDAALEARIIAEPDDTELLAVYRDWLIQHGNPLGEVFAFANSPKARQQTLATHAPYLWGSLLEYRQLFKADWGPGGISAITITRSTSIEIEWPIVIGWLLDLPITVFLRALVIGPLPSATFNAYEDIMATVLARPRPGLRTLVVNASQDRYRAHLGSLPPLATALPNLRELVLIARGVELSSLDHPHLHRLALDLDSGAADAYDAVAAASCPAVEVANLRLPIYEPSRVGAFFQATGYPALEFLELDLGPAGAREVVRGVLGAPWLARLRELNLRSMRLDESARAELEAERRQRLAHLERLDLGNPPETDEIPF